MPWATRVMTTAVALSIAAMALTIGVAVIVKVIRWAF